MGHATHVHVTSNTCYRNQECDSIVQTYEVTIWPMNFSWLTYNMIINLLHSFACRDIALLRPPSVCVVSFLDQTEAWESWLLCTDSHLLPGQKSQTISFPCNTPVTWHSYVLYMLLSHCEFWVWIHLAWNWICVPVMYLQFRYRELHNTKIAEWGSSLCVFKVHFQTLAAFKPDRAIWALGLLPNYDPLKLLSAF